LNGIREGIFAAAGCAGQWMKRVVGVSVLMKFFSSQENLLRCNDIIRLSIDGICR
jgi:hypothetical protein